MLCQSYIETFFLLNVRFLSWFPSLFFRLILSFIPTLQVESSQSLLKVKHMGIYFH